MGNGDDSGGHVPGEPREGAQGHEDAHPEQVQVVASSLLQGAVGGESLFLTTCWGGQWRGGTELSPKQPFGGTCSKVPLGLLEGPLGKLHPEMLKPHLPRVWAAQEGTQ